MKSPLKGKRTSFKRQCRYNCKPCDGCVPHSDGLPDFVALPMSDAWNKEVEDSTYPQRVQNLSEDVTWFFEDMHLTDEKIDKFFNPDEV